MITTAFILIQATQVLSSIGTGFPKLEPICWGPGVWPHPQHCRLFTLCLLDPSRSNSVVTGHLFLCPPGTGFSAGHNACISSKQVTNCHHNTKYADNFLEESPAERLLPAHNTREFDCGGQTVPYCDDSDMLVVCAPNQGFLGAVNCSKKALGSPELYQCDKRTANCKPLSSPAEKIHMRIAPSGGSNYESVSEYAKSSRSEEQHSFGHISNIQNGTTVASLSRKDPAICRRSGKQCASTNRTLLVECSDDLQVVQVWDCYSFFPLVSFQGGNIEVICDPEQDSCAVHVRNGTDYANQTATTSGVKNGDTSHAQDSLQHVCQRPGRQCVPKNASILVECSQDLKLQHVWNCASFFSSESSNVSFECDSSSNSCVAVASSLQAETELYHCHRPGMQCSAQNSSVLLHCSDNLQVLNVWPCSYLLPVDPFQDRAAVNSLCDPERDSCILYLNEPHQKHGQKPEPVNEAIEHQCTGMGIQCSTTNSSFLLECSETLALLNVWDCTSLIPSEILHSDILEVTCDRHHSTCVVYTGEDGSFQKDSEETVNKGITSSEPNCRKPGKQCVDSNRSLLVECSENLEVLHVWDCASLLSKEGFRQENNTWCSFEQDSCVSSFSGNSTSKFITDNIDEQPTQPKPDDAHSPNKAVAIHSPDSDTSSSNSSESSWFTSQDNLLQACHKEGLQCADNHTIMDCPYDLSEPNFLMSCSDVIQVTHNEEAFGYCHGDTPSCVLSTNQEALHLELSVFDMTKHSVFPDFLSKCAKGGLYCADNTTLVMCSGFADNLDYSISCGQHQSSSGTRVRSFCDPQTESCVVDAESSDILEALSHGGKNVTLKEKKIQNETSTVVAQTPQTSSSSTSSSWQNQSTEKLVSQLKQKLSIKPSSEETICTSPGWKCLSHDILILCSDQLSLEGFVPCQETLRGIEGHSFCDTATSKCTLKKRSANHDLYLH